MSRTADKIVCSDEDLQALRAMAQDQTNPKSAKRAAMVLETMDGARVKDVAAKYGESPSAVSKWRMRFAEDGTDGLKDAPRGSTLDVLTASLRTQIPELLKQDPPDGAPVWTEKLLAKALNTYPSFVSYVLEEEGIYLPIPGLHWESTPDPDRAGVLSQVAELPAPHREDSAAASSSGWNSIRVTIELQDEDGVVRKRTITMKDAIPDPEHFDMSTLEGFRRDFGIMERALSTLGKAAVQAAMEDIRKAAAEKADPSSPCKD